MARVKVWLDGEILTASDLNAEFDNALASSLTPDTLDDVSGNLVEMQAVADPYPAGAASLATTMRGEIQRLRYLLKQITGKSEWYIDPDTTIAAIQTALTSAVVLKTLFDANTILAADADNVPAAVTIAEDRVVGRKTGGNITALTLSEILDFIGSAAAGDILYRGASSWERLAKGTTAQYLKGGDTPSWATPLADGDKGDITVSSSGATWTIDSGVVSQAKLKTSSGSVSFNVPMGTGDGGSLLTLPGGEYGFYPRTRSYMTGAVGRDFKGAAQIHYYSGTAPCDTGTASYIYLYGYAGDSYGYVTATQRYVTSSGEVFWIFILRDKETKRIISVWEAPDHPCFGNGGDPSQVPHPFIGYNPSTDEIMYISVTDAELAYIKDEANQQHKSISQLIIENYEIDDTQDNAKNTAWPTIEVTVGLPEGYDWQMAKSGDLITPIKKTIPKPDYVLVRSIAIKEQK